MPRNDAYAQVAEDEGKPLQDSEYDNDYSNRELQALTRSLQRTNMFLKIIIGIVGAAVVAFILTLIAGAVDKKEVMATKAPQLLKTPVPDIPDTVVTFQANELYMTRPKEDKEHQWDRLLPPGRGFVYVDDNKKYNLPLGQETPWGQIFSVSLFHQLHCLGQIRSYLWSLLEGIENDDKEQQQAMLHMLVGKDKGGHLHHCFDYIRQGIMCAGDMSMEWPKTEKDGVTRVAVDGWGIPHVCKNWDLIDDYMQKYHFNMSTNDNIAPHGS